MSEAQCTRNGRPIPASAEKLIEIFSSDDESDVREVAAPAAVPGPIDSAEEETTAEAPSVSGVPPSSQCAGF